MTKKCVSCQTCRWFWLFVVVTELESFLAEMHENINLALGRFFLAPSLQPLTSCGGIDVNTLIAVTASVQTSEMLAFLLCPF